MIAVPVLLFVTGSAAAQAPLPLIPIPEEVEPLGGTVTFARTLRVEGPAGTDLSGLRQYAAGLIKAELDWRPTLPRRAAPAGVTLRLTGPDSTLGAEGYRLTARGRTVVVEAPTQAGLFYGLQTLRQLLHVGKPFTLPAVRITDAPRFHYRGMHLDVGRHFFPVEFVEQYIDLLSRYKFNTFHWHLTDDQGWRIEIKAYPRLTEVGSCRKETILDRNFDPYVGDGIPYCGFYTQAEIRRVVAYAAARHITIIPEIEMPGHSQAAIAAYPELACTPGPFEVSTMWGVDDDILCPSEYTFQFIEGVLTEVMALFPGPYIHIGGDEAPKVRWQESPLAQAVIQREGLADEHALQSWFIQRIERFLNAHGRRLIGWDEILEGGLAPDATVMSWRGVSGGIAAAREGHDVVMTPTSHAYFDYSQGDPALEPFGAGGNLPLERVYTFEPVPTELTPSEATHVLGAQGNVWTEYIKTPDRLEWMVFPRMLAMAEVTWSPASARDWASFIARLPSALAALDRLGANYRVPNVLGLERSRLTLGDTVMVTLRSPMPSGEIRYTLDGTTPTAAAPRYDGTLTLPVDTAGTTVTAAVFLPGGQVSPPRRATFARTTMLPATVPPAAVQAGLCVQYMEGSFDSAKAVQAPPPDSSTRPHPLSSDTGQRPHPLSPSPPCGEGGRTAIVEAVALPGFQRPETYALAFWGYLHLERAGLYTLALSSDDGSVLELDGRVVVDNDGWHSEQEKTGMVALAAGYHPLTIRFVQGSGGAVLSGTIAYENEEPRPLAGAFLAH